MNRFKEIIRGVVPRKFRGKRPILRSFCECIILKLKKTIRLPVFYSQQGEDKDLFKEYFRKKRKGFFIELGAMDGITYSNTKFFEDTLGWTGILIEPVREYYEQLVKNRSKCFNYNCAVGKHNTVTFIGRSATAGMVHTMASGFREAWYGQGSQEEWAINCRPLSEIIRETGLNAFDFLSLDVEGGELEVLQSIDWSKTRIRLVLIELDGWNEEKDSACRRLLKEQGFEFRKRIGDNDLWENSAI